MNKKLNLAAIIMRKKPGYTAGKNKVWCTDFTYMRQPNGRLIHNCTIIDLFDRSAVASVNRDYINTDLAKDTFKSCFYYRFAFESVEMLVKRTREYINWYNYVRPQSYNNYLTPMEARFVYIFTEQSVTKKVD